MAANPGLVSASITREQLVAYVREHQVELREVVLEEGRSGLDEWEVVRNGPEDYDVVDGAGTVVESGFLARQSAQAFIEHEQRKGDPPKYGRYQLPGGKHYRELLLTLPYTGRSVEDIDREWNNMPVSDLRWQALAEERKAALWATTESGQFRSSHFEEEPNVLVHVRFNERTDTDGRKVLFLEEIQSDWHQVGRRDGYQLAGLTQAQERAYRAAMESFHESEARSENAGMWRRVNPQHVEAIRIYEEVRDAAKRSVPDAPLRNTDEWALLAFKRMVRWAAENSFDRVGWTTGEQQAERYDLSKHVKDISWKKSSDGTYDIEGNTGTGEPIVLKRLSEDTLEKTLGKEIAGKVIAGIGRFEGDAAAVARGCLENTELRVGGEGMSGFYDQILPKAVNRWAKKFGASVGELQVEVAEKEADRFAVVLANGKVVQQTQSRRHADATAACFDGAVVRPVDHTQRVHGLTVTPAMRDAALEGLPLFKRAWHGSPYSGIEKTGFKLAAVGTGEGAQAYGWGIYFASQREVAEQYQASTSRPVIVVAGQQYIGDGAGVLRDGHGRPAAASLTDVQFDAARALCGSVAMKPVAILAEEAESFLQSRQWMTPERIEAAKRAILDGQVMLLVPGYLYQAEIPKDEDLLNWDVSLSMQPVKVRQALEAADVMDPSVFDQFTGQQLYEGIVRDRNMFGGLDRREAAQATSEFLQSIGLPGLRYLDGYSRDRGEGTHNYVIWDETLLRPEVAQIMVIDAEQEEEDDDRPAFRF